MNKAIPAILGSLCLATLALAAPTAPEKLTGGIVVAHGAAVLKIEVYAGDDGTFPFSEDDVITYWYEMGAFALTPLKWGEASRVLALGARTASFPGMLTERTFPVVFVSKDRPVGYSLDPRIDETVRYNGNPIAVPFR